MGSSIWWIAFDRPGFFGKLSSSYVCYCLASIIHGIPTPVSGVCRRILLPSPRPAANAETPPDIDYPLLRVGIWLSLMMLQFLYLSASRYHRRDYTIRGRDWGYRYLNQRQKRVNKIPEQSHGNCRDSLPKAAIPECSGKWIAIGLAPEWGLRIPGLPVLKAQTNHSKEIKARIIMFFLYLTHILTYFADESTTKNGRKCRFSNK